MNPWPIVGGAVWGGYGTFRRRTLSLEEVCCWGQALVCLSPLPVHSFLFVLEVEGVFFLLPAPAARHSASPTTVDSLWNHKPTFSCPSIHFGHRASS